MSVIDELLDLQAQDSIIKSLEKQVHDIPKRRKIEQDRVDEIHHELQRAKDAVENGERSVTGFQLEIDAQRAQMEKYEKQRQEVKTNAEYAALGRQIESCRRVATEYEQRIARAREHIEAARESIGVVEARYAEEAASVEAYVASLRAQLLEVQQRRQEAEAVRAEKAKAFDVPEKRRFLSYYERLSKKCFPVVFRVREGNGCPGCHMVLPPSKMQEAQRNAMLADTPGKMNVVACDYCGRLIFK